MPVDAQPPEDSEKGWKPDPLGASKLRWWDGEKWTSHIHTTQQSPQQPKKGGSKGQIKWIVGAVVVALIIGAIASAGDDDGGSNSSESTPEDTDQPAKEASGKQAMVAGGGSGGNQKAASGKVEVKVLDVTKNPSIPNWVSDDTFNDNHTVIGVKVRVKNETSRVKAADFYLQGRGGYEVSSLTAIELDAGEQTKEELLFGYLTSELPAVKLKVIEPFDNEVLFTQGLE